MACSVSTCRPMVRSRPSPSPPRRSWGRPGEPDRGQVQAEPGGIRDGEPAHRGQQQLAAHLLSCGASASSDRPSWSSSSSAAGTPSSSAIAAEDADPATSYSGAGEHSPRRQHRRDLPCPASARPRRGITASTIRPHPGHAGRRHHEQRPDVPLGARRRLAQPGQPGGQLLEPPAGDQLIEAAEVRHTCRRTRPPSRRPSTSSRDPQPRPPRRTVFTFGHMSSQHEKARPGRCQATRRAQAAEPAGVCHNTATAAAPLRREAVCQNPRNAHPPRPCHVTVKMQVRGLTSLSLEHHAPSGPLACH